MYVIRPSNGENYNLFFASNDTSLVYRILTYKFPKAILTTDNYYRETVPPIYQMMIRRKYIKDVVKFLRQPLGFTEGSGSHQVL